jgi:MFS family permease
MGGSSYARLFQNAGYLRVFSAGIGSVAGQAIASVCLVWLVFEETGSALDVGALGAANVLAALLLSTFGGTLVDRYDRRRLMIASDVARCLAMTAVVLVLLLARFDLLTILVAYAVVGGFSVVFNPAEQAIVPALVGASDVADANGLVRSSRSAISFAGASIGGVLIVTVGSTVGIAVNAATFALSALLLAGMRVGAVAGDRTTRRTEASYFADLKAGFAWLRRATGFLELTVSATFFNFCYTLVGTFLVFFATAVLHGSALVYAALLAAEVAGTAIGSLLVGRLGAARYAGRAWVIPYGVLSGAALVVLALAPLIPVAVLVLFAMGVFSGFAGTAWLTAAQLLVPSEMQGRYFGIDALGSVAIIPAAQIGGAFLIAAYGTEPTYLAIGVLWLVAGLAFLAPRALWGLGVDRAALTRRSDDAEAGTPGSPEESRGA